MESTISLPLYSCYIHYNEFDKTWNVFSRDEQLQYLNDKTKMTDLVSFNSFEELTEAINESLKSKEND
jgi:hypothetical protein